MNSEQSAGGWLGDWVLVWGDGAEPGRKRNAAAPWQPVARQSAWTVWQQPSDTGWRGFPFLTGQGEGWHYWLLGELYGLLPARQPAFILDVLTGRVAAAHLNGHFLLCAWQETTHQWHIWTDRFGTLHGYYAQDGRRAALGSYSGAVSAAASRRQLDWVGLTSFFSCGFFLGNHTQYDDMQVLRPATHLVLDEQGQLCREERYWAWQHQPDRQRSQADTGAEFAHLFGAVIHEQMGQGRVAVPISGGLDSRSVVAALGDEERGRVWAYSYGYLPHSVETQIAQRVAQARQLPFQAFTIPPYLFDRLPQVIGAIEGFQDITQCRQAAILPELAEQAEFVSAAHWGDVWLDDMGLAGQTNLGTEAFFQTAWKKIAKTGRDWLVQNVCQPQLGQSSAEAVVKDLLQSALVAVAHLEEPDFRLKAFKTEQWSARWTTASLRMYQPAVFPRLPFYDTRLTDFFAQVPTALVAQRQLQVEYLKQAAPDLARIIWQRYGYNLYWYPYRHYFRWPRRLWRGVQRWLTTQAPVTLNWQVQFLHPQGKAGLQRWLLQPGLRLHEWLAPAVLQERVAQFMAHPYQQGGYSLAMLLTFSAWLEAE